MKALILGANGRFGRSMDVALRARGWSTTAFERDKDDLYNMAKDVDAIIYGWNPAYHHWQAQYEDLTKRVIEAANLNQATVFFPGNVYVYGDQRSPWNEETPHRPINSLGEIRARVEEQLNDANVQTITLRGGDFIDTQASGNWFDLVFIKKLAKGVFLYPGALDAAHAWAYLPDFAKAGAMLLDQRDRLKRHSVFNFEGYTLSANEIAEAFTITTGRSIRAKTMSWLPFYALAPVMPLMRKIVEMRYLWNVPHELSGRALREFLPEYQDTPIKEALRSAIAHINSR